MKIFDKFDFFWKFLSFLVFLTSSQASAQAVILKTAILDTPVAKNTLGKLYSRLNEIQDEFHFEVLHLPAERGVLMIKKHEVDALGGRLAELALHDTELSEAVVRVEPPLFQIEFGVLTRRDYPKELKLWHQLADLTTVFTRGTQINAHGIPARSRKIEVENHRQAILMVLNARVQTAALIKPVFCEFAKVRPAVSESLRYHSFGSQNVHLFLSSRVSQHQKKLSLLIGSFVKKHNQDLRKFLRIPRC